MDGFPDYSSHSLQLVNGQVTKALVVGDWMIIVNNTGAVLYSYKLMVEKALFNTIVVGPQGQIFVNSSAGDPYIMTDNSDVVAILTPPPDQMADHAVFDAMGNLYLSFPAVPVADKELASQTRPVNYISCYNNSGDLWANVNLQQIYADQQQPVLCQPLDWQSDCLLCYTLTLPVLYWLNLQGVIVKRIPLQLERERLIEVKYAPSTGAFLATVRSNSESDSLVVLYADGRLNREMYLQPRGQFTNWCFSPTGTILYSFNDDEPDKVHEEPFITKYSS